MIRRLLAATGLALALTFVPVSPASACPNCKEAVAEQPPEEAARLKSGYFYSILLMVSMPFVLAGAGAFFIVRAVKRGGLPEL
jgi:hypothetical protein